MASHFKVSGEAVEYLKRKMTESDAALKAFNAEQDKAAQKAQQSADAMQRLRDSMFGTDSIAKANEYLAALGPIENLTKMSAAAQASMNAELGKAIDAYTRMGQTAPQAIRDIYTATLPLPPIVAGLGAEWASVGEKVSVSTEQIVGDLKKQSDAYKKQLADFETETQRQVDAWNRGERGADQVKRKIEETTEATRQLTTAQLAANEAVAGMGVRAAASASEVIAMGRQLESMYRQAGIFVSGIQVAMGGYTQSLRQQAGREITGAGVAWGTGAGATSTANTLNVNVNSTDASKIAEKLVGEMKHAGYRL
jgi:hypothetical protein